MSIVLEDESNLIIETPQLGWARIYYDDNQKKLCYKLDNGTTHCLLDGTLEEIQDLLATSFTGTTITATYNDAGDVFTLEIEATLLADINDAISKAHTQNTDIKLDQGNPNEVTAADLRAHLDNTAKHVDWTQPSQGTIHPTNYADNDNQNASEVPVTPTGNLTSTDTQAALEELQGDIDNINNNSTEAAQDAVGNALVDSASIDFTYNDVANTITADVLEAGVDHNSLNNYEANRHFLQSEISIPLNQVNDVEITAPTDNEVLAYDSTSGDWINQTPSEAGLAVENHTHTASDITDFNTAVAAAETDTTLTKIGNTLRYVGEDGTNQDIDLTPYLDDTNLARLVSGTLNVSTGILTVTRDDTSTFTIDLSGLLDNQNASEVPVTPVGDLTSTNVQSALEELQGEITGATHDAVTLGGVANDTTDDTLDLNNQVLTVNLVTPTTDGAMSASDKSKLDGIESGATADQVASEVPVTPTGNLTSTDVQAALEELQGDIDNITTNSAEDAQDAIGAALTDTATIDFTYDDLNNVIKADVIATAIDHNDLINSGGNAHIDWTLAGQGTIHPTNYADNGEANTASNVGTSGIGVYDSKSGVDLRFKKLNPLSNKIAITDDAINDKIDFDVNEANLTLTSSQISDFQSSVSSNTDVANNTTNSHASGSDNQNLFETFACPNGTNPVADSQTDTLTFTSSDSSVTITGNSATDTIDLVVATAPPSGLQAKAGSVAGASFTTGSNRYYDVVFSTAFVDANYSISIDAEEQRKFTYSNKTASGFRINSNASSAITGLVDWIAIKHGES